MNERNSISLQSDFKINLTRLDLAIEFDWFFLKRLCVSDRIQTVSSDNFLIIIFLLQCAWNGELESAFFQNDYQINKNKSEPKKHSISHCHSP